MRQQWPGWQPEIITNKWVFRLLPIIFGGGNLIVIIWGAKPRTPGTTPRYWWPIIFFFIMAASFIYWGIMMITQVETTIENKKGEKRTIGNLIGFEVRIYNETDDGVPQAMQEAMVQSRLDGSRRRVGYKASLFHTDLGNLENSLTKTVHRRIREGQDLESKHKRCSWKSSVLGSQNHTRVSRLVKRKYSRLIQR
jgi:hypothetical protein